MGNQPKKRYKPRPMSVRPEAKFMIAALSRPIMIHICKDGTISYRDASKQEPVFNGVALPVFSVDTVDQAREFQVRFGRKQYTRHPDNGMDWYRLSVLEDGTDPAWRGDGLIEIDDLDGIARMFNKFWETLAPHDVQ